MLRAPPFGAPPHQEMREPPWLRPWPRPGCADALEGGQRRGPAIVLPHGEGERDGGAAMAARKGPACVEGAAFFSSSMFWVREKTGSL
jgi:hypothetical protein